jgi:hypothetical protein
MGREESLNIAGWNVEITWDRDNPATGPQSLTIRPGKDLPARERGLGIKSGIMRQVEKAVMDLVNGLESDAEAKYRRVLRARVEPLLKGDPRSSGNDYYTKLLKLHDEIEVFSSNPAADIATAMGAPVKTIRSRLARARELATES